MGNDLGLSAWAVAAAVVVCLLVFGGLWVWGNRGGRISLVDIAWGAGFGLIALVGLVVSSFGHPDRTTQLLLVVMPVVWGVRLAVHNGRRLARHDTEDPRYEELIESSDQSRARTTLLKVVAPQALFMVVVSLPITVGQNNESSWWPLTLLGLLVWAVGVFFEGVGDWQLERFKAEPDSEDQVMDRGLWHYTRHPNYFGDVCNWLGIWLVAAHSWPGLATVVAPALMAYTIIAKTGSAMTEKKMADSKPGFEEYVDRTSAFIPLPPKKAKS